MAFFMRLQSLPLEAQSRDVRHFFKDFQIPVGGVHIVGGDNDEAHITFASEEDLLQALQLDNQLLCGKPVRLLLAKKGEEEQSLVASQPSTHHQSETWPGDDYLEKKRELPHGDDIDSFLYGEDPGLKSRPTELHKAGTEVRYKILNFSSESIIVPDARRPEEEEDVKKKESRYEESRGRPTRENEKAACQKDSKRNETIRQKERRTVSKDRERKSDRQHDEKQSHTVRNEDKGREKSKSNSRSHDREATSRREEVKRKEEKNHKESSRKCTKENVNVKDDKSKTSRKEKRSTQTEKEGRDRSKVGERESHRSKENTHKDKSKAKDTSDGSKDKCKEQKSSNKETFSRKEETKNIETSKEKQKTIDNKEKGDNGKDRQVRSHQSKDEKRNDSSQDKELERGRSKGKDRNKQDTIRVRSDRSRDQQKKSDGSKEKEKSKQDTHKESKDRERRCDRSKEKDRSDKSREQEKKHGGSMEKDKGKQDTHKDKIDQSRKQVKKSDGSKEKDKSKQNTVEDKIDQSGKQEKKSDGSKEKDKSKQNTVKDRIDQSGKQEKKSDGSKEKDKSKQDIQKEKHDRSRDRERGHDRSKKSDKRTARSRAHASHRAKDRRPDFSRDSHTKELKRHSSDVDDMPRSRARHEPGHVIVFNLPCTVTATDLRDYFSGYEIADKGVIMTISESNPGNLNAGVKFVFMEDAIKAEAMNAPLHGRQIDIQFVSERMFIKTLESRSSQGTAQESYTPGSGPYPQYGQFGPPGPWPHYFQPPGPFLRPPSFPGFPQPSVPSPSIPPQSAQPPPPSMEYFMHGSPYYPPNLPYHPLPYMGSAPTQPHVHLSDTEPKPSQAKRTRGTTIANNIAVQNDSFHDIPGTHQEGLSMKIERRDSTGVNEQCNKLTEVKGNISPEIKVTPPSRQTPDIGVNEPKPSLQHLEAIPTQNVVESSAELPKPRGKNGDRWPYRFIRVNNLDPHESAQEVWSKLKAEGPSPRSVALVRNPDNVAQFAIASYNREDEVTRLVARVKTLSLERYNPSQRYNALTTVAQDFTITEAFDSDKECPATEISYFGASNRRKRGRKRKMLKIDSPNVSMGKKLLNAAIRGNPNPRRDRRRSRKEFDSR